MRNALLLFCLICLAFSGRVVAQNITPETERIPDYYNNSVYLEIGGNGGFLTLNYEHLIPFAVPNKTLALRIGGIFIPERNEDSFNYEFYLPVEASLLLGKKAIKLELGLGTTLTGYGSTFSDDEVGRAYFNSMEVVSLLRVGGRWQKPGKHWFVRVGFTPVLMEMYTVIEYPFSPWAGISVGYNFGRK